MTHEEKINYMRIAAGICGYGFDPKDLDMLVSLYELVIEKQGEADLKTICRVEADVKKRAGAKTANVVGRTEQLIQSCSVCGTTKHPVFGAHCKASNCPHEH